MPKRLTISERFDRLLKRVDKQINPSLVSVLNRASVQVRDYIRQRHMGGANTSPNRLARNTGAMERHTVAKRAEITPDGVRAGVEINVPYATTHFTDIGRTSVLIKAKNGNALTIPILKGSNHRAPKPASEYPRRFAYNGLLYAAVRGKGILPIFALRTSVVIPIRVNIQRDIQPYADKVIREDVEKTIAKLLGN